MESQDDIALVKKAVSDDASAKEAVSRIADPLIRAKTRKLCRQYCHENHFHYQCTIIPELAYKCRDVDLCDWGNHSYSWMLEDLCSAEHLSRFTGENGAKLTTYFFAVINSLPFYERWKDWRFDRRIRVPTFIEEISPIAGKCFYWLRDEYIPEVMAQKAGVTVKEIEDVLERIMDELTERGKLHLLTKASTVSLTSDDPDEDKDEESQMDITDSSWDPSQAQLNKMIRTGLGKLTPVEQFVLEMMVIEERDAVEVLEAFRKSGISFKEGVSPDKLDRQQLYYFKRTALAKLARVSGVI